MHLTLGHWHLQGAGGTLALGADLLGSHESREGPSSQQLLW